MEYSELIKNRRAVRDYKDQKVSLDLLKEIIKESTLAPSSGHGQPWKFVIINNKDMIKRLSDESKKNIVADIKANPGDPRTGYLEPLSDKAYNIFYNAPALIIITGESSYKHLFIDCALCAAYIMNAAVSRGMGTNWIGLGMEIRDKGLLKELGIPENYIIVAPIIIGYPSAIPPVPPRNEPEILKILEIN